MTRVLIRARDRADQQTLEESSRFDELLTVIDLQPNLRSDELASASADAFAQCSSCTMRSFLHAQADLHRYPMLAWIDRAFGLVPRFTSALAAGDSRGVSALAAELGAEPFEVVPHGARPFLSLARVELVRAGAIATGTAQRVVVEPAGSLADLIATLASVGAPQQLHVGHIEHASQAELWGPFVVTLPEGALRALLVDLARRGRRAGLAMALPACASLQFRENIGLEAVRARSDVAFRSLTGTASMMCPDNVSGYAAVSDARAFARAHVTGPRAVALRYHRLLLTRRVA